MCIPLQVMTWPWVAIGEINDEEGWKEMEEEEWEAIRPRRVKEIVYKTNKVGGPNLNNAY